MTFFIHVSCFNPTDVFSDTNTNRAKIEEGFKALKEEIRTRYCREVTGELAGHVTQGTIGLEGAGLSTTQQAYDFALGYCAGKGWMRPTLWPKN